MDVAFLSVQGLHYLGFHFPRFQVTHSQEDPPSDLYHKVSGSGTAPVSLSLFGLITGILSFPITTRTVHEHEQVHTIRCFEKERDHIPINFITIYCCNCSILLLLISY